MNAGRDLDRLIAERVMGLLPEDWPHLCEAEDHNLDDLVWCYDCSRLVDETERIPPLYSTSIMDAWNVVERMQRYGTHGSAVELVTECVDEDGTIGWLCSFTVRGVETHQASAVTAPLAISLAALKTVGFTE